MDYPARRLVDDVEDVSVMRPAGVHRELGKGVRHAADDDDGVIRRPLVAKVWPKPFPPRWVMTQCPRSRGRHGTAQAGREAAERESTDAPCLARRCSAGLFEYQASPQDGG